MKIDVKRFDRQKECIKDVFKDLKSFGKSCIYAAPGFGKTFMITDLVFKNLREKKSNIKFLTLIGSSYLRSQWVKRANNQTDIKSWQKIYKDPANTHKCDILIIDEIHKILLAPKYINVLKAVNFKKLIVMTGTLSYEHKEKLKELGIPISHKVTLEECVENGWVNNYSEFNVSIPLNGSESYRYNRQDTIYKTNGLYIDPNIYDPEASNKFVSYGVIGRARAGVFEGYIDLNGNLLKIKEKEYKTYKHLIKHHSKGKSKGKPVYQKKYYNAEKLARMRNMYIVDNKGNKVPNIGLIIGKATAADRAFRERNKIAYHAQGKIEFFKDFVKRYPDRKIITFSKTTAFCDMLEKQVAGKAYHGTDSKANRQIMDDFINDRILVVHTVGKIKEGADIPGVDTIIHFSYDSKKEDKIQKDLRGGRDKNNVNKTLIFNTYSVLDESYYEEETFELGYLLKSQEGREYLNIESLNEI